MSDIIEKTYLFLDALDNSDLIKNLTKYKNKLLSNKDLLSEISLLKTYTDTSSIIDARKALFSNSDYSSYMTYYNELSLIIMEINKKYKEYTFTYGKHCH